MFVPIQGVLELSVEVHNGELSGGCGDCLRSIAVGLHDRPVDEIPVERLGKLTCFAVEGAGDFTELVEMYGGVILECTKEGCTAETDVHVWADRFLQTDWENAGFSYLGDCVSLQPTLASE